MIYQNGCSISLVTDANMLRGLVNNPAVVIVALTANPNELPKPNNNIHVFSDLVPPTPLLMMWADGAQAQFLSGYNYELANNPACHNVIITLLATLVNNNVVLYIPQDEFDIFGMALLEYIRFIFGITVNSLFSVFSFDDTKIPFILSCFYMEGYMTHEDFIASYPKGLQFYDPAVLFKLGQDFGIMTLNVADLASYFFNMCNANYQQQLVPLIRRVDLK